MTAAETDVETPAFSLDPTRLGEILLKIVPASVLATHSRPVYTIRDYLKAGDDPELAFIRDLFSKSTEQLADRWYGGMDNTNGIVAIMQELRYGQRESAP